MGSGQAWRSFCTNKRPAPITGAGRFLPKLPCAAGRLMAYQLNLSANCMMRFGARVLVICPKFALRMLSVPGLL